MSEHDEQCAVVEWFKWRYPLWADCIIAIPNGSAFVGGKKDKSNLWRYNYLVKEGLKKGVSDLFIAVSNGKKHGLWIEMKDKGKTLCAVSEPQREHIGLMQDMGYAAMWCAGFDEAKKHIELYFEFKELECQD